MIIDNNRETSMDIARRRGRDDNLKILEVR